MIYITWIPSWMQIAFVSVYLTNTNNTITFVTTAAHNDDRIRSVTDTVMMCIQAESRFLTRNDDRLRVPSDN
ncbi:unnamed protein product [Strongylus vulgaris]|uniref:Uncharacterized protein n=1 Tax=Strongylus vulgaris TaxID=40348 RepID=A0A3P7L112_STRVU|nr:unnamed protein product [Strongylus vulgaris]